MDNWLEKRNKRGTEVQGYLDHEAALDVFRSFRDFPKLIAKAWRP